MSWSLKDTFFKWSWMITNKNSRRHFLEVWNFSCRSEKGISRIPDFLKHVMRLPLFRTMSLKKYFMCYKISPSFPSAWGWINEFWLLKMFHAGIFIWAPWMSVQHVMEKHPTFVDIFQIGPKWWADQQIDTASPTAMLPAWLKKGKAERRKRKKNDRQTKHWQTSSPSATIHLMTLKADGLCQSDRYGQAELYTRQCTVTYNEALMQKGPKIPSQWEVLPSPSSALRHGPVCFSCSLPPSYHHMDGAADTPV